MKKIFLLPICVLAACAGCSKDNSFNNGDAVLNGAGSTSGVTGATTIAVSTDEEDLISRTSFDRTITIRFNEGGQATVSGDANNIVKVNGNNSLSDGTSYTETPATEDEKAAFFSEGQLIFSGSGSLSVSARGKAGITSDDYLHFMASPTIKVTSAAGHAVRGKEAVIVSDGVLEATATAAMKKGVASDSLVLFNGGVTTVTVSGGTGFDGMGVLEGSASGGTAVSLSTYSSGSGMGGPGGGRGW